jgi:hypothetical protein
MGKHSNHSPVRDPFLQAVSIVRAQRTLQVHQGTYGAFTETISRNYLAKSLTHCLHGIRKIENTQDINRIKEFFPDDPASRTLLVREVFDNSGFPQIPQRNNEASAQSCVHSPLQKAPVCHKTDKVRFHKFSYDRYK